MTNLFYIMGKSASGKDTIYKKIKNVININEYIPYTTRPIRTGEIDGIDYNFITNEKIKEFQQDNKIIESREYKTVHGLWVYATVADKQLEIDGNILTIGTLESYNKIKQYFKKDLQTKILPIYIKIDEPERRRRAILREERQEKPKFKEMERRLKADNIDFSNEKLKESGISEKETFENYNIDECVSKIVTYIKENTIINYKDELRRKTANYEEEKDIIEEER